MVLMDWPVFIRDLEISGDSLHNKVFESLIKYDAPIIPVLPIPLCIHSLSGYYIPKDYCYYVLELINCQNYLDVC